MAEKKSGRKLVFGHWMRSVRLTRKRRAARVTGQPDPPATTPLPTLHDAALTAKEAELGVILAEISRLTGRLQP